MMLVLLQKQMLHLEARRKRKRKEKNQNVVSAKLLFKNDAATISVEVVLVMSISITDG